MIKYVVLYFKQVHVHAKSQKKLMMMEKQVMMKKQMEMFQIKQNMMKQAQVKNKQTSGTEPHHWHAAPARKKNCAIPAPAHCLLINSAKCKIPKFITFAAAPAPAPIRKTMRLLEAPALQQR
jgi:hypothetical protein